MAIYLKFGNVKGNVTADGFAGQIAVGSVSFGVSRNVSMEAGNLSNRESSKPNLSEIVITKVADNS
ncbi:MAG: type VI secretion system tube protein Hcp, partial [Gammaproteobacteria bacterium]